MKSTEQKVIEQKPSTESHRTNHRAVRPDGRQWTTCFLSECPGSQSRKISEKDATTIKISLRALNAVQFWFDLRFHQKPLLVKISL